MSDPYANLGAADLAVQEAIADAMQARAADPAQIALRRSYLEALNLPEGAFAVEFGSGTGEVTHDLIDMSGAARALGIEPGPVMVKRALKTFDDRDDLSFQVGDAAETGLEDNSVDLVVMHTLLCHAPAYDAIMTEAARITKPGGLLAIFDGDYDTATCAIGDFDPLDEVVQFMIDHNVTNRWITRQLRPLMTRHGFSVSNVSAHAYLADETPSYFMTVIERALTVMQDRGLLSEAGAEGLRTEMKARIESGAFFGFMSYISAIGTRQEAGA